MANDQVQTLKPKFKENSEPLLFFQPYSSDVFDLKKIYFFTQKNLQVTGGSISSNSGLSPGSLILKINGIETSNLTHKEAEELIKNSQAEVVLLVAKGITTWKPEVTVLGGQVQGQGQGQEVYTQTSLAKNQQGQGQGQRGQINNMAKPFQAFQAGKVIRNCF